MSTDMVPIDIVLYVFIILVNLFSSITIKY